MRKKISLGIFVAFIAMVAVGKCHAQTKEQKQERTVITANDPISQKIEYDTIKLQPTVLNKLQSIEEQYRNLENPKWVQQWVDQQKNILVVRHQTILETTAETKGYEPSQLKFDNGNIIVPKIKIPEQKK